MTEHLAKQADIGILRDINRRGYSMIHWTIVHRSMTTRQASRSRGIHNPNLLADQRRHFFDFGALRGNLSGNTLLCIDQQLDICRIAFDLVGYQFVHFA